MSWSQMFAQSTPSVPSLAPLVQRVVQGGLWTPPGSTAALCLALVGWLVVLAIAAALVQGDWHRWLRGLVDIRAHWDQIGAGLEILRRNKRPLWILLISAVVSWTGWSLGWWFMWQGSSADAEKERVGMEALLAVRNNSAMGFAAAHALAAGLVPLRALTTLGDLLPILLGACLVLFARSDVIAQHLRSKLSAGDNLRLKRQLGTLWVGLLVLIGYRVVTSLANRSAGPVGSCLWVDCLFLPVMLLASDGLLLSWVLTEFGRSLRAHLTWQTDDTVSVVRGVPAGMFVCGLANPGRYVILGLVMWAYPYSAPAPPAFAASSWGPILWCAALAQVVGMTWFGLPCVIAVWRQGGLAQQLRGLVQLVRRAGGQLVGLTALAVVLNVLAMMPLYWLFGSMQAEPWSLLGAATYGYYAQLMVNLSVLAGVTELARQELGLTDEPKYPPIVAELFAAAHRHNPVEPQAR